MTKEKTAWLRASRLSKEMEVGGALGSSLILTLMCLGARGQPLRRMQANSEKVLFTVVIIVRALLTTEARVSSLSQYRSEMPQ